MGVKTTASVLIHIVVDSIRHPFIPSTIYVDMAGKVRVLHKKNEKAKGSGTTISSDSKTS